MTGEFEQALQGQLDMLHNLTRRLTDSRHDAEDLLQDTCLASWQAWARHGSPEDPRAWWATICLNLARSRWRRRRTRPLESSDAEIEQTADRTGTHPSAGHVELEALTNLQAATVHQQLARLPHHQREAIVLMDLCGFTASQVGALLELPRGTVLSRVHRGHKALALLLNEATLR